MNATFKLYSDTDLLASYAKEAHEAACRGDHAGALEALRAAKERYADLAAIKNRLEEAIAESRLAQAAAE
jgi:hypothetical protein